MNNQAYELLALLMRYVFIIIGAVIVFRAFRWMRKDARAYKREMRSLPDAGLVGEIVDVNTGRAQPLPREGTMGASRVNDIRVKGEGVMMTHARFEFVDGRGLKIIPAKRNARVFLGGNELKGPGFALHGTQVQIGASVLRVRLFAGLKVPQPAAYPAAEEIADDSFSPGAWSGLPPDGQTGFFPQADGFVPCPPEGFSAAPQEMDAFQETYTDYDGHFTEDGQMTWQYAYSLDDLRHAMEENQWRQTQVADGVPDQEEDEAALYEKPVQRRRRRRRHE